MSEDSSNSVSLKEYVDVRFTAMDMATKLALETVKVAMDNTAKADSQRVTQLLSIISMIISVGFGVYMMARHI